MVILNGCVKLRAIEEEDYDLLFRMVNSPDIENEICGWAFPISKKEQQNWMDHFHNSESDIKLIIECRNGKAIGMISLSRIDWKNRTAVIGYKTDAPIEWRMKGDTIDAVNGILNYAFNELGLHCIIADILEYNTFSKKLIKKAGFFEEGRLRERIYKNGAWHDVIMYSLLKSEFDMLQAKRSEKEQQKWDNTKEEKQ